MESSTRSLTVPTKEAANERRCPCGCAPCEGTCCHLDCIVRPRFFCGQLLTDADLSSLLKWARDRFGLSRYRHGWGVVCGLDVRCDPKRPAAIVVTPGYAVNCCGDDIVVCEETTLDLSAACREEADPCADLRRGAPAGGTTATIKGSVRSMTGAPVANGAAVLTNRATNAVFTAPTDSMGSFITPNLPPGTYRVSASTSSGSSFGAAIVTVRAGETRRVWITPEGDGTPPPGEEEDEERLRVVDIYLRYDEKPSEPTTALGRGSCKQVSECEYSRTRESYKLTWEFGVAGSDPLRARAVRWHEGYEKCLDVLRQFRAQFLQGFPAVEVRRWLLRWIDAHPQHRLCATRDRLCRQPDADFSNQERLVNLFFQLVQDCRNAYLNCDCFGCDEDRGVPLARVWLMTNENGGREGCRIMAIDPYPPYRRPIQPECWPAPLGYVNVGRFIWHRWEEACTALADLGVRVRRDDFRLPPTLAELETKLLQSFSPPNASQCSLFVPCNEERVALVYNTGLLGNRVVGFCAATVEPPPPPPPCPTIEVNCSSSATAGEQINFTANVRGGDPSVTPTFNWSVSAGTIQSGQGTNSIAVDTMGLSSDSDVRATVEVGGYAPSCPRSASCTTALIAPEPLCPMIDVHCPAAVPVGDQINFTANVRGGDPSVTPTFNWSVSAGTIQSGQGTNHIVVDTNGLPIDSDVRAIVEVGGYDPSCQRSSDCQTYLLKGRNTPLARKLDEYKDDPFIPDDKSHLNQLAADLQHDPDSRGHIIVYGGRNRPTGEAQARADSAKDFLVNTRGVDPSRIVALDGGLREELTYQLWVVPAGATPPTPTPTLLAERRDDLTEINLIGPARAARLNGAGIRTFAELASTPVERLKELIPEVGEDVLKGWIESAKSRMG